MASLSTTAKDSLVNSINELLSTIDTNTSNIGTNTTNISTNTTNIGTNTSSISTINTNIGVLSSLSTTAKDSVVNSINELFSSIGTNTSNVSTDTTSIGTLSSLTTTAKDNLVNSINEVKSSVDTNTSNISTHTTSIGTLASLATTAQDNLVNAINEVNSQLNASGDSNTLTLQNDSIEMTGTNFILNYENVAYDYPTFVNGELAITGWQSYAPSQSLITDLSLNVTNPWTLFLKIDFPTGQPNFQSISFAIDYTNGFLTTPAGGGTPDANRIDFSTGNLNPTGISVSPNTPLPASVFDGNNKFFYDKI